jgi:hypothetical protein
MPAAASTGPETGPFTGQSTLHRPRTTPQENSMRIHAFQFITYQRS